MVPITKYPNMICHNITLTLGNILICTFPCIKGETDARKSSCIAQGCSGSLQSREDLNMGCRVLSNAPSVQVYLPKSVFVRFSLTMVSNEVCKLHGNVISGVQISGRSL